MNTRRTPARRVEDNEVQKEIPPQVEEVKQGDQVPIVGGGNDVSVVPPELSDRDIREALLAFSPSRDYSSEFEYGA